jgi:hypothetical protein
VPTDVIVPDNCQLLDSLNRKLALLKDRVRSVVAGYHTGLYLCGVAGLGKSYSVTKQLEELGADYRLFNARMTAKGLFLALQNAPDTVHVLEDMERLVDDRDAQGLLRSALWAQPGKDREVTWTTATGAMRCTFRGGIIMLSNRPLSDLPEMRALASRISLHKLEVSDAEMAAHVRRIAAAGFARGKHQLEAERCLEVAEYVIGECKASGCPLDLRLFDNSCLDYLQWAASQSSCHWHDLVANRVRQSATHFRHEINTLSREARLEQERALVRDICAETRDPQERVRLWEERTGKHPATFYRRKREIDSAEFNV